MINNKIFNALIGVAIGILVWALCFLPLGSTIGCILIAFMGACYGPIILGASIFSFAAASFIGSGVETMLLNLCLNALPAAAIAIGIRKLKPFEALILSCAGFLMAIWGAMALIANYSGVSLADFAFNILPTQYIETMREVTTMMALDSSVSESIIKSAYIQLQSFIAPATLAYSMIMGSIGFGFCQWQARKRNRPFAMKKEFKRWNLPQSFLYAIMIMLLISFLGMVCEWRGFEEVYMCVNMIFSVGFALQGLSTLIYFLRNKAFILLSIFVLIFSVIFAGVPLILLGIVDSSFKLRARMEFSKFMFNVQKGEFNKEEFEKAVREFKRKQDQDSDSSKNENDTKDK